MEKESRYRRHEREHLIDQLQQHPLIMLRGEVPPFIKKRRRMVEKEFRNDCAMRGFNYFALLQEAERRNEKLRESS